MVVQANVAQLSHLHVLHSLKGFFGLYEVCSWNKAIGPTKIQDPLVDGVQVTKHGQTKG